MTDQPDDVGSHTSPTARPGSAESNTAPAHGHLHHVRNLISSQVSQVVVGQQVVVDQILICLAVRGHVLLEGVPGVAKTLLASALAKSMGLGFKRAQFTPDMLPSDLTGTMSLRDRELVFRPGPVFTNVLLADEINRTPPKTQAALLEAMQETQVTVEGEPRALPEPFLVVATQNPIEYEGTYPLPEAQLDRFLIKVTVDYPSEADELNLLRLARSGIRSTTLDQIRPVVDAASVANMRAEVDATRLSDEVLAYAAGIIRATRILPSVQVGASPRAGVHLLSAARAVARLGGRDFVTPDDVAWASKPVLSHRLVLAPEAELDRFGPDEAIAAALQTVPVPR